MFVFDNKKFISKVLNLPFKSFYILDSVEELEIAANLYRASLVIEISDCYAYLKSNLLAFTDCIKVDKVSRTVSGSSKYYYHNHYINDRLKLACADNDSTREKLIQLKDIVTSLDETTCTGKYILFPLDLDRSNRVTNFDSLEFRVTETSSIDSYLLKGTGLSVEATQKLSQSYSASLVMVKTRDYIPPEHSYKSPEAILAVFMDRSHKEHYIVFNDLKYRWNSDMSKLYSAPSLKSIHSLGNTVNSLEKATVYINNMRGDITQCNPCENCVFATSKLSNKCSFMSPRCNGITLPNIGGEAQWKNLRKK